MSKRFVILTIILLLSAASCIAQQKGGAKEYTIEQFLKNISVTGGFFSADESSILISSNETGIYNIYSIDIKTGKQVARTSSKTDSFYTVGYFPNDERILFESDKGGNNFTHLFMVEENGDVRELTVGEKTRELFLKFSDDGKSFFTSCTQRTQRLLDIYKWDVSTMDKQMVFQNDDGYTQFTISPDNRWLAMVKLISTNDSDINLADLQEEGKPVLISRHEGEARFYALEFSRDNQYLYYRTDLDREFLCLKRYELASGKHEDFCGNSWDVNFISFSRSGRYQVIGVNEEGVTKIEITDTVAGKPLELPDLPQGQISNVRFSPSEKLMLFFLVSDTVPSNIFLFDIEANRIKQLTDTLNPEIDPDDLVTNQFVRFKARDGLEIPGFLYKPKTTGPDNKCPAIIWVHDGPRSQFQPGYHPHLQFLINHGYAIFAINQRGSSGYGKKFLAADDYRHGREPLWDCVDAKEFFKTVDWIDQDKVGIMGVSVGGYMVLAGLTFQPDEFSVGVDLFGISNILRFLEDLPDYWTHARQAFFLEFGDPQMDESGLRAISPYYHAENITKPLFVVHGANDPFVSDDDVKKIVNTVRKKNGVVEFMVFDDEGFSFSKTDNIVKAYNAILAFLDRHLR